MIVFGQDNLSNSFSVGGSGNVSLPLIGLVKASGLTTAESFGGHHPDSVVGQQVIDQYFPAGAGQPVIVAGNPAKSQQLLAAFRGVPGITAVAAPQIHAGHVFLQGTLTSPPDSQAAYTTIDKARSAVHAVRGADALVGGNTAINLDVQRSAAHDRDVIIPLILLVVFIILGLLLLPHGVVGLRLRLCLCVRGSLAFVRLVRE